MCGGDLPAGIVEVLPHEVEFGGGDVRCGCGKGAVLGAGVEPWFEIEVGLCEAARGVQRDGLVAGVSVDAGEGGDAPLVGWLGDGEAVDDAGDVEAAGVDGPAPQRQAVEGFFDAAFAQGAGGQTRWCSASGRRPRRAWGWSRWSTRSTKLQGSTGAPGSS